MRNRTPLVGFADLGGQSSGTYSASSMVKTNLSVAAALVDRIFGLLTARFDLVE